MSSSCEIFCEILLAIVLPPLGVFFRHGCCSGSNKFSFHKDGTISRLLDMGYQLEDAVAAVEKCGADSPLEELTDFIYAMETAKRNTSDLRKHKRESPAHSPLIKMQKIIAANHNGKRPLNPSKRLNSSESLSLPIPMIGFGIPGMILRVSRQIPHERLQEKEDTFTTSQSKTVTRSFQSHQRQSMKHYQKQGNGGLSGIRGQSSTGS